MKEDGVIVLCQSFFNRFQSVNLYKYVNTSTMAPQYVQIKTIQNRALYFRHF
jgi:hypothetical protein